MNNFAKPIKQERSIALYEAYIEAGFDLLNQTSLDCLTIPGIAKHAGSSVGGFYSRFKNKETYFRCLIERHVEQGSAYVEQQLTAELLSTENLDQVIETIVKTYTAIFIGRGRGVIRQTYLYLNETPELWEPMRQNGRHASDLLAQHLGPRLGTDGEQKVRFAVQVLMSTLVNDLVNPNHPFKAGQTEFEQQLTAMISAFLKH